MKYLIFLLLPVFSFGKSLPDTAFNPNDTIPNSIQIQPIIVNMYDDSATQIMWKINEISRDTNSGGVAIVSLFSRSKKLLMNMSIGVPASVINQWGIDPKPIDDFILSSNKRFKREIY